MMVEMFMLSVDMTLIFGPSLKHMIFFKGMDLSFNIDDVKLWWKHEEGCLQKDLKPFVNDEDVTMLTLFAEKNICNVKIYTEPRLSRGEMTYMERLIENQKGHQSVKENESVKDNESIEDSLDDIHFEDSEEKRMYDFNEDIDEGLNIEVDNGESRRESVDGAGTTSQVKVPKPAFRTFIGPRPKLFKSTIKPMPIDTNREKGQTSTYKPSMSDHVKLMISIKKKAKHVEIPKRISDRLRTLKTRDIVGPGMHVEDPFVIPEEDTSVGSAGGNKTWNDIHKSLTQ
ncbi:hypothetical protein KIW84_033084 [Lathyrus oleraceus]|uniref:Uncharacterized protein n=1 Tax=Pisum sativum TaxID=3888 RepID=A0A9D4Y0C5_PEA|nr:hypothetical protein KIW84_033084 [Pisum sativum]